mgnify:CR=1 FL=1
MKKFLLVITMLFSLSIMSRDRLDDVMEVLKYVESFNDPSAIGDGGDSYGVLQNKLHTWRHVSSRMCRRSF